MGGVAVLLTEVVGIVATGVARAGVGSRDKVRGSSRNSPSRRHLEYEQWQVT